MCRTSLVRLITVRSSVIRPLNVLKYPYFKTFWVLAALIMTLWCWKIDIWPWWHHLGQILWRYCYVIICTLNSCWFSLLMHLQVHPLLVQHYLGHFHVAHHVSGVCSWNKFWKLHHSKVTLTKKSISDPSCSLILIFNKIQLFVGPG